MIKSLSRIFRTNNDNKMTQLKEKMHLASNTFFYGAGKPIWSERNYSEFASEAYIKNVIAHRTLNMIAQAAASVPIKLFKIEAGVKQPLQHHPLLTLLEKPNPMQSGNEFFQSIYLYRQISGNAYVRGIPFELRQAHNKGTFPQENNSASPQISLAEMHLVRPDRVQIIAGAGVFPISYRCHNANIKSFVDYEVDQINGRSLLLHIKNFHPFSDWYGLSSIEAAAFSIDQHNQASAWNQALLQNGARPAGVIKVKNSEGKGIVLNDEQFDRLKQTIEDTFSGAENAGRPLLLEGGLEWQEMSLSHKDMGYNELQATLARYIALALGMPPQLLGIPGDNTYSNLAEARIALWEQTILPLVGNTLEHFNRWLKPYFSDNLLLEYEVDNISALANRTDAIWHRLEKASFMSNNEKRRAIGLGPLEGEDDI